MAAPGPRSVDRARTYLLVWAAFWALVVLLDVVHDLVQVRLFPEPYRDLPYMLREWGIFWGSWVLVSAPWTVLVARLGGSRRRRTVALALVVGVLASAAAHLGIAAAAFRLVDGRGTLLGRWAGFALTLGPRDVLIAGALVAVLVGWRRHLGARGERLLALQRHLRPHFVYNVLNGLSGALRGGQHQVAVEIVARLGRLLRAEVDQPDLVELHHELAMVRDYLGLEALRMGPRMQVAWSVDPDVAHALVPSFLVQPVAENAVRHGVERSMLPVRIELRVTRERARLRVEVDDSGPGPAWGPARGGLGVLRSRLQLVYGAGASCSLADRPGGGTRACITLPFVTAAR